MHMPRPATIGAKKVSFLIVVIAVNLPTPLARNNAVRAIPVAFRYAGFWRVQALHVPAVAAKVTEKNVVLVSAICVDVRACVHVCVRVRLCA